MLLFRRGSRCSVINKILLNVVIYQRVFPISSIHQSHILPWNGLQIGYVISVNENIKTDATNQYTLLIALFSLWIALNSKSIMFEKCNNISSKYILVLPIGKSPYLANSQYNGTFITHVHYPPFRNGQNNRYQT